MALPLSGITEFENKPRRERQPQGIQATKIIGKARSTIYHL